MLGLFKSLSNQVQRRPQLVESRFLWRQHDLHNNEVCLLDGIRLVPTELNPVLNVKAQQYPMHCDSLEEELKTVDCFKLCLEIARVIYCFS